MRSINDLEVALVPTVHRLILVRLANLHKTPAITWCGEYTHSSWPKETATVIGRYPSPRSCPLSFSEEFWALSLPGKGVRLPSLSGLLGAVAFTRRRSRSRLGGWP